MITVAFTRPDGSAGSIKVEHGCDLVRLLALGMLLRVPADAVWSAAPKQGHQPCHHPQPVHNPVEEP